MHLLFHSYISGKFDSLNKRLKSLLTSNKDFPQHKQIIRFRHCDLQSSLKKDDSFIIETSR